jgi:hypothetical protein
MAMALIATAMVSGCGRESGPPRVRVAGTVTYQGKPVENGQISFRPIDGTVNPVSGADIVGGKYEVIAGGGVAVGAHRIEIVASRPVPLPAGKSADDYSELGVPMEPYIPAKYNRESELKVEVTLDGPKEFSFDLK